jgi:GDP/UDP-N,N'-diacetylbacillosamine 2-epimerase (hydrolysing)
MGVATINIGPRQDGRLKAPSIIDIKPIKAQILKAIKLAYSPKFQKIVQKKQNPYGDSKPSKTIVKVLKNINLKDITVKRFKDLV